MFLLNVVVWIWLEIGRLNESSPGWFLNRFVWKGIFTRKYCFDDEKVKNKNMIRTYILRKIRTPIKRSFNDWQFVKKSLLYFFIRI
jgi:hypothetical protein